jgi:glutamine---fructose-6-phosphate transaminase (isomerizing)
MMNGNGLETRRAKGKISMLEAVLNGSPVHGTVGIAHTRWATHGAPNECNAHPQHDCAGEIAVVHNGIIENYSALRTMLQKQGHTFQSETDTEVLAHLIEAAMNGGPLEDAVIDALNVVEGTYGIAVVSSKDPEKIVCARKGSPLLIGLGDGEHFVASDVAAILAHTRQVVYLDDGEMGVLTRNGYEVLDLNA